MSKPFDEDAAVNFDPFGPDETDVSPLSDKIVTAGKDHAHCMMCDGPIPKGSRHRARTERNNEERKIMTFRWCGICCRAMAQADDWDRWEISGPERLVDSRDRIGEARRQARRATTQEQAP